MTDDETLFLCTFSKDRVRKHLKRYKIWMTNDDQDLLVDKELLGCHSSQFLRVRPVSKEKRTKCTSSTSLALRGTGVGGDARNRLQKRTTPSAVCGPKKEFKFEAPPPKKKNSHNMPQSVGPRKAN